jgi:uncharacterized membrane protein
MVLVHLDDSGYNGHILLEPNISLSWKTNVHIFAFIVFVTSVVAGYFLMRGGWLVLPFSGLELLMIGTSLTMFFHHYNRCEVIKFSENKVIIEQGKDAPEKSWEYQRHWSSFHVQDKGFCCVPILCIKSHGKKKELGTFLGYEEKKELIEVLEDITNKFSRASGKV